jgi:hypothetical protein
MARLRTADNRREFAAVAVFISTAAVFFLAAVPDRARQAFQHRKSHWFFCQSGNSSPQSERLFCEFIGVLWRPPFDSGSGVPTDRTNDPFRFLLTALIVFAFGPGLFSIDALLKRVIGGKTLVRPDPRAGRSAESTAGR